MIDTNTLDSCIVVGGRILRCSDRSEIHSLMIPHRSFIVLLLVWHRSFPNVWQRLCRSYPGASLVSQPWDGEIMIRVTKVLPGFLTPNSTPQKSTDQEQYHKLRSEADPERTNGMSFRLFERLQRVRGIPKRWRFYVRPAACTAAPICFDTGRCYR